MWLGRDGQPGLREGLAWHLVGDLSPDVVPADPGELALWIEPDGPDEACHVYLGEDTHFAAVAPTGVHRFEWVGPSERELPELRTRGCKAYVHASKKKFIDAIRADGGDVELHVIEGDVKGTRFLDFGGVVCEMFYRADLTVYG